MWVHFFGIPAGLDVVDAVDVGTRYLGIPSDLCSIGCQFDCNRLPAVPLPGIA